MKEITTEIKLTLVVSSALIIQMGIGIFWAGAAMERLALLERQAAETNKLIERTIRLDAEVKEMQRTLHKIDSKLGG